MTVISATAQMPMINDVRTKLLLALDENESYFELTLVLRDVVADLENHMTRLGQSNIKWNLERTINDFTSNDYIQMGKLTHYMSPTLLRSIIKGTVAYDFCQGKLAMNECYKTSSPGTYVVSVAIKGRQGKSLGANELSLLAGRLRNYAAAGHDFQRLNRWDQTDSQHTIHRKFIQDVEGTFLTVANDLATPKFAESDSEIANIEALAQSIQDRSDKGMALDVTGSVYQQQAPLMVGCTHKSFDQRFKAFVPPSPPNATGLDGTTHTWALLLCALKDMGHDVDIVKLLVIVYYRPEDLPLSERLISVYAQSYVFQDGLNVIQAGTKKAPLPAPNELFSLQKQIFCYRRWLVDNINQTIKRGEYIANRVLIHEHHIQKFKLSALPASVDNLKAALLRFELKVADYVRVKEELKEKIKQERVGCQEMEDIIQRMEDMKLVSSETNAGLLDDT